MEPASEVPTVSPYYIHFISLLFLREKPEDLFHLHLQEFTRQI